MAAAIKEEFSLQMYIKHFQDAEDMHLSNTHTLDHKAALYAGMAFTASQWQIANPDVQLGSWLADQSGELSLTGINQIAKTCVAYYLNVQKQATLPTGYYIVRTAGELVLTRVEGTTDFELELNLMTVDIMPAMQESIAQHIAPGYVKPKISGISISYPVTR